MVAGVSGWLYKKVATSTTVEPRMKVNVIWRLKSATDARKEMTMLKLVAKPLRILSAYLMTMAVKSPPATWMNTVAQAQTVKFAKRLVLNMAVGLELLNTMGTSAGSRENKDS